jgi:hypothetical protein
MMPRITKGMIAAAHRELETIRELATDSFDGPAACYQYHAQTASNHIATLVKAGQPLPDWLLTNWRYFKAMGWRGDVALPR